MATEPGAGSPGPQLTAPATETPQLVQTMGCYRLLQYLGEGGMGEVWLAEQTEPVRRQVALKVIKPGMGSKQVVARFELERQALALMDHPTIATVLDGGITPDGRPYFAMEYVKGEPITAYCDRQRLSTAERLELFIQVCEGVQHAHQKGIIHRDLKPSNVLVAVQDDSPVPKIIDFGVAKAMGQPLTDRSLFTELGVLIGTPEYMSPEQAEMSTDIDTRTDVYALGVMLYELLTGALPFEREALRGVGVDAIRRTIREKDPPRPSTRVTSLGSNSGAAAAHRRTDPMRLAKQLRGDLDWITLKALEKDRTRRYATPNTLAADVRSHLNNDPVSAGAPGTLYRTGKFVRRHRFGVAATAAFLLLLIVFGVTMAVQAQRVTRERDRANEEARAKQQVAEFLQQLFRVSDPARARGTPVTAREILDEGVRKLETAFADQPAVRAELSSGLGEAYEALGSYAEAERLMQTALMLRRQAFGDSDPKTLSQVRILGTLFLQRLNRRAEATALLSQSLESARGALGEDHDETLKIKSALATALSDQEHFRDAEALFREVIDKRRRIAGDPRSTLVALNNLSGLYHHLDRFEDSARLDSEILEARRRTLGEDHPDTIDAMNNLAVCLTALKRYDQAQAVLDRAMQLGQKIWGATHPEFALVVHSRGELAQAMGDLRSAEAHLLRALAVYDQTGYASYRPLALYELAQVTARLEKQKAAVGFLARAIELGYKPQGASPTIRDDPQLRSLRGYAPFEALVSGVPASRSVGDSHEP